MRIKKFTKRVRAKGLQFLNLALINLKKFKHKASYEVILPDASFAPWKSDVSFNEVFDVIKQNTLVDKYRCYELWQLVEETSGLNGALIEVGVWRGGTGNLIAKRANQLEIKDKIYLCDTFTGVVKASDKDATYKGGEHSDTAIEIVESLSKKLALDNTVLLKGIFPEQTQHLVRDNEFRFCHIDVDVYDSAKDIFNWIWPKLVIGGIVVFDDYGFDTCEGIPLFVDMERKKNDRTVIHNLNGHAIIIKHNK